MNIDATIAVGFLIVFVLVNIAGALFFHLAEDVTEPGYGSPTPNGVPYVPPHFTTDTPGVIALATELSRRLAETPAACSPPRTAWLSNPSQTHCPTANGSPSRSRKHLRDSSAGTVSELDAEGTIAKPSP